MGEETTELRKSSFRKIFRISSPFNERKIQVQAVNPVSMGRGRLIE
jgi:hypothetical protein